MYLFFLQGKCVYRLKKKKERHRHMEGENQLAIIGNRGIVGTEEQCAQRDSENRGTAGTEER